MTKDVFIPRDMMHLPHSESGMRIGLFGGSFNPPHLGHRLVSRQALKKLNLDQVWWLVSPGNPLKSHDDLMPLAKRLELARDLITLPRVTATGFEAKHDFSYTYDTLKFLTSTLPDRKFVWIMGADNLASFHKWERWRDITKLMPMAVYVRPGSASGSLGSRAAHYLDYCRLDENDAHLLCGQKAPAWVYLHGMMSDQSSTALRQTKANK